MRSKAISDREITPTTGRECTKVRRWPACTQESIRGGWRKPIYSNNVQCPEASHQNISCSPTDEASVGGEWTNLCDQCEAACGNITVTFTTPGRTWKSAYPDCSLLSADIACSYKLCMRYNVLLCVIYVISDHFLVIIIDLVDSNGTPSERIEHDAGWASEKTGNLSTKMKLQVQVEHKSRHQSWNHAKHNSSRCTIQMQMKIKIKMMCN